MNWSHTLYSWMCGVESEAADSSFILSDQDTPQIREQTLDRHLGFLKMTRLGRVTGFRAVKVCTQVLPTREHTCAHARAQTKCVCVYAGWQQDQEGASESAFQKRLFSQKNGSIAPARCRISRTNPSVDAIFLGQECLAKRQKKLSYHVTSVALNKHFGHLVMRYWPASRVCGSKMQSVFHLHIR